MGDEAEQSSVLLHRFARGYVQRPAACTHQEQSGPATCRAMTASRSTTSPTTVGVGTWVRFPSSAGAGSAGERVIRRASITVRALRRDASAGTVGHIGGVAARSRANSNSRSRSSKTLRRNESWRLGGPRRSSCGHDRSLYRPVSSLIFTITGGGTVLREYGLVNPSLYRSMV